MCGVIGLRCAKDRADLGAAASKLLRMLEYRGYDSTGAILQSEDGRIVLRKDVGSPTVVTKRLAIAAARRTSTACTTATSPTATS